MRLDRTFAALALCGTLAAGALEAQSLRGSRGSVDRMYRQARSQDLTFYRTGKGVRSGFANGNLVRMSGNADYRLAGVAYPYALPTTRTFVQRLARQYRSACGEKLVVTSAVRPTSYRLANGADKSVHPAGMAVDIRKPRKGRCLTWLRQTLMYLELAGTLEATEERRPPHFHVAVFPSQYRRYVSRAGGSVSGGRTASSARSGGESRSRVANVTRYRVRRGDSLWTIARRHNTSVERLKAVNDMRSSRIVAGQTLVIPAR
ncbi:MAG TPA: DUF5715 family protein [Longimicrobiaceae bacterium]|nr:DUF5715 family protein [Longimicrobiaceae bacterium]